MDGFISTIYGTQETATTYTYYHMEDRTPTMGWASLFTLKKKPWGN